MDDHDRIVEMHTSMKYIHKKMSAHCKTFEQHDKRLDKLENWRSRVNGVIAGIGLAVGGVWAKLTKMI